MLQIVVETTILGLSGKPVRLLFVLRADGIPFFPSS
jgi:hypothetical protein